MQKYTFFILLRPVDNFMRAVGMRTWHQNSAKKKRKSIFGNHSTHAGAASLPA
jgi:hypothetical protein